MIDYTEEKEVLRNKALAEHEDQCCILDFVHESFCLAPPGPIELSEPAVAGLVLLIMNVRERLSAAAQALA